MKKLFVLLAFVFCLNYVVADEPSKTTPPVTPGKEATAPAVKEKVKTDANHQDDDNIDDLDDSEDEEIN